MGLNEAALRALCTRRIAWPVGYTLCFELVSRDCICIPIIRIRRVKRSLLQAVPLYPGCRQPTLKPNTPRFAYTVAIVALTDS